MKSFFSLILLVITGIAQGQPVQAPERAFSNNNLVTTAPDEPPQAPSKPNSTKLNSTKTKNCQCEICECENCSCNCFNDARDIAIKLNKPLVIWIKTKGYQDPAYLHCHVNSLYGDDTPRTILARPSEGKLYQISSNSKIKVQGFQDIQNNMFQDNMFQGNCSNGSCGVQGAFGGGGCSGGNCGRSRR